MGVALRGVAWALQGVFLFCVFSFFRSLFLFLFFVRVCTPSIRLRFGLLAYQDFGPKKHHNEEGKTLR